MFTLIIFHAVYDLLVGIVTYLQFPVSFDNLNNFVVYIFIIYNNNIIFLPIWFFAIAAMKVIHRQITDFV